MNPDHVMDAIYPAVIHEHSVVHESHPPIVIHEHPPVVIHEHGAPVVLHEHPMVVHEHRPLVIHDHVPMMMHDHSVVVHEHPHQEGPVMMHEMAEHRYVRRLSAGRVERDGLAMEMRSRPHINEQQQEQNWMWSADGEHEANYS